MMSVNIPSNKNNNNRKNFSLYSCYSFFIVITILFILSPKINSFIVQTTQGWKKCFNSQLTPGKTLYVKFHLPRAQQKYCQYRLSIQLQKGQYNQAKLLHQNSYQCNDPSLKQPYVFKHTPQSNIYQGFYSICLQNVQDNNQYTFAKLDIEEIISMQELAQYQQLQLKSLVDSTQLLDLGKLVSIIKKRLGLTFQQTKNSSQIMTSLSNKVEQTKETNLYGSLIQIGFLVVYGIVWLLIMKTFKKR